MQFPVVGRLPLKLSLKQADDMMSKILSRIDNLLPFKSNVTV